LISDVLGFIVWDLGFGIWDLRFELIRVQDLGSWGSKDVGPRVKVRFSGLNPHILSVLLRFSGLNPNIPSQVAHKSVPEAFLKLPFICDLWGASGVYMVPRRESGQMLFGSIDHR
jgi:hypothetical protein